MLWKEGGGNWHTFQAFQAWSSLFLPALHCSLTALGLVLRTTQKGLRLENKARGKGKEKTSCDA